MDPITDILQYIPQRPPIVMVSELISATATEGFTRLCIKETNIFCDNGRLQEPGLIENIAQSAAAMSGYNAVMNNESVKKGFIGSVNDLKIHALPAVGDCIDTHISIENLVMNVQIIKGTVKLNDDIIAECNMKIFLEE